MAKKKMKTETKPARASGRARDLGTTRIVTVEIPTGLDDAVERYRQENDRTKKSVIVMALKQLLTEAGFWPPAD